jgi:hypothetical protein
VHFLHITAYQKLTNGKTVSTPETYSSLVATAELAEQAIFHHLLLQIVHFHESNSSHCLRRARSRGSYLLAGLLNELPIITLSSVCTKARVLILPKRVEDADTPSRPSSSMRTGQPSTEGTLTQRYLHSRWPLKQTH